LHFPALGGFFTHLGHRFYSGSFCLPHCRFFSLWVPPLRFFLFLPGCTRLLFSAAGVFLLHFLPSCSLQILSAHVSLRSLLLTLVLPFVPPASAAPASLLSLCTFSFLPLDFHSLDFRFSLTCLSLSLSLCLCVCTLFSLSHSACVHLCTAFSLDTWNSLFSHFSLRFCMHILTLCVSHAVLLSSLSPAGFHCLSLPRIYLLVIFSVHFTSLSFHTGYTLSLILSRFCTSLCIRSLGLGLPTYLSPAPTLSFSAFVPAIHFSFSAFPRSYSLSLSHAIRFSASADFSLTCTSLLPASLFSTALFRYLGFTAFLSYWRFFSLLDSLHTISGTLPVHWSFCLGPLSAFSFSTAFHSGFSAVFILRLFICSHISLSFYSFLSATCFPIGPGSPFLPQTLTALFLEDCTLTTRFLSRLQFPGALSVSRARLGLLHCLVLSCF